MKISQISDIEISGSDFKSHTAGISKKGLAFIIEGLSNNLYSNKIESIIREYTSNMMDAIKVENKLDKPCYIIFSHNETDDTYWIEFKDYGCGMNPKFIKDVFMNWGDSDKRISNDTVGGFGLGSKVGLSYTDNVFITTIQNNIEYSYILSKTNYLPEILLLSQKKTLENNGTSVKLQIQNNDLLKFHDACISVLTYFKNIIVINPFHSYNNDFKIIKHDLFYVCNDEQHSNYGSGYMMRINESRSFSFSSRFIIVNEFVKYNLSTGDVFNILKEKLNTELLYRVFSLTNQIHIKFNIGELDLTLSRENIEFTEKTINSIINKFKQIDLFFTNYIKNKYDSTFDIVKRSKFRYIDINENLYIDLSAYVYHYYELNNNIRFCENITNFISNNANIVTNENNYLYHTRKYKYYTNYGIKNINTDDKIIHNIKLKYFNIPVDDYSTVCYLSDIGGNKKSLLRECKRLSSIINKYKKIKNYSSEDSKKDYFTNMGYLVSSIQTLKKNIKENFICIDDVPEEYINHELNLIKIEKEKKEEEQKKLRRLKRIENKKNKEEKLKNIEINHDVNFGNIKNLFNQYIPVNIKEDAISKKHKFFEKSSLTLEDVKNAKNVFVIHNDISESFYVCNVLLNFITTVDVNKEILILKNNKFESKYTIYDDIYYLNNVCKKTNYDIINQEIKSKNIIHFSSLTTMIDVYRNDYTIKTINSNKKHIVNYYNFLINNINEDFLICLLTMYTNKHIHSTRNLLNTKFDIKNFKYLLKIINLCTKNKYINYFHDTIVTNKLHALNNIDINNCYYTFFKPNIDIYFIILLNYYNIILNKKIKINCIDKSNATSIDVEIKLPKISAKIINKVNKLQNNINKELELYDIKENIFFNDTLRNAQNKIIELFWIKNINNDNISIIYKSILKTIEKNPKTVYTLLKENNVKNVKPLNYFINFKNLKNEN